MLKLLQEAKDIRTDLEFLFELLFFPEPVDFYLPPGGRIVHRRQCERLRILRVSLIEFLVIR